MVKSLGTAYWNTLDGLAPATPQEAARAVIYTPVTIVPDQSIRGGPSGLDHAVIRGGVVGCSSVTYDDGLAVKPGARYLFFGIGPLSDSSGKVPERSVVFSAWPFATDGSVTTPKEGSQSIQALTSAIAAHPAVSSGQPLPFPSSTVVQPSPSDTYP